MRHFLWILSCSCCLLTGFLACIKSSSTTAAKKTATLTLSATNVERGAPLVAAVNGSTSADIKWTVFPSRDAHITSGNGQAMILFPRAGDYWVVANYSSGADSSADSAASMITVNDSIYAPVQPGNLDTTSMAGVQVTITPMTDSNSRLVLLVQSTSVYDCFPTFVWTDTASGSGGSIGIGLLEIVSGSLNGSCNGAKNPAASYLFPGESLSGPLSNGVYPIAVTVNSVTYRGSYTVTDNAYTFNWSYTSGVTISPAQVSRP
jgi:hypothetical protein